MQSQNRAIVHQSNDDAIDAMLGQDVDIAHHVAGLWRRLWLIALVAILSGAAVAVMRTARAPMYRASATLAASGSKIGDQTAAVLTTNFRPLIENNSVAATVTKEFALGAAPHRLTPETFLLRVLSVEEIRNSNLIRLSIELTDPDLAARVANRVADLAVEGARRLSQNEAVQARDDIQVELERARSRLEETSAQLEKFRAGAQLELVKGDVDNILYERGRLADLALDIESERAKLARTEAELASRKRIDSLTRSIDSDSTLAEAARATEQGAKSVLGLQLKSEEINKVYEALEQAAVASRTELAALEKRWAQLINQRKLNAAQQPKLTELYKKEAELARMEAEYKIAENSYKEVAARYDIARLQVAGRSAQLQVIDRAIVPTQPKSSHRLRDALFAAIAGATLVAIAIVVAQVLADMLRRARAA